MITIVVLKGDTQKRPLLIEDYNNSGLGRIAKAASSANNRCQAHPLCWTLLTPHPGLKTRCELDKNLSATHKSIEKIGGEKEQMMGHHGYFLPDC